MALIIMTQSAKLLRHITIRIIITFSIAENWLIRQLDANIGFLNGDIQEEVYNPDKWFCGYVTP